MRYFFIFLFLSLFTPSQAQKNWDEQQLLFFKDVLLPKVASICQKDNGILWGESLYCPLILANPDTYFAVSNDTMFLDDCRMEQGVYCAFLPNTHVLANSDLSLNGKTYAILSCQNDGYMDTSWYVRTAIHEMFHVFQRNNAWNYYYDNRHLEEKWGRVYLQMELSALQKAVMSDGKKRQRAITEALSFREQRFRIFPSAEKNENNSEIIEGLACYTEYRLCLGGGMKEKIINDIKTLLDSKKSYMRIACYCTGCTYAYLNDCSGSWQEKISQTTSVSDITKEAYRIKEKKITGNITKKSSNRYDYSILCYVEDSMENIRNTNRKYISNLLETSPVLKIDFKNCEIGMNQNEVFYVEGLGTYFNYCKVSGPFGNIYSGKGCLLDKTNCLIFFIDSDSILTDNNKEFSIFLNEGWNIIQQGRIYHLSNSD